MSYTELAFANVSHDTMKIRDIDGYKETVKKYLQVEHHHRIHGILIMVLLLQATNTKPPPEKNIQKLHKRLYDLNNKIAQNPSIEDLKLVTEDLKLQLQE
ncbi:41878_t:CDS:2, partial [Gigaspora margarita]